MKGKLAILAAAVILSGCKNNGSVYHLYEKTINHQNCEAEGTSELFEYEFRYFYVTEKAGFGDFTALSRSCENPEKCKSDFDWLQEMNRRKTIEPQFQFVFDEKTPEGYWGRRVRTGIDWGNGICEGGMIREFDLEYQVEGEVVIRERITYADDHPIDELGQCDTIAAANAAKDNMCSEYRVYYGSYEGPF